ncbi:MAG: hypothetical protein J6Z11_09275 [Candidatus Riflebacteria bacterium]|nr:hypothetical protein [Candidatus Riflebacteria bacterium]
MKKDYTYRKLHPLITGRCTVISRIGSIRNEYHVDLDTGVFSCARGAPSRYTYEKGPIPNPYCSHKLKAIYNLYVREKDPVKKEELYFAYTKAVATRYNIYEVCSAFHKELRIGSIARAWYWAQILIAMRGKSGLVRYMLNIVYEETRNHLLAEDLFYCFKMGKDVPIKDCYRLICWFCQSPKKWELGKWRYHHFFFHEMLGGYFRLMDDFGNDVVKAADIIPYNSTFLPELRNAFMKDNHEKIQYYLKGLQKMQHKKFGGLQGLRKTIYEALANVCKEMYSRNTGLTSDYTKMNGLFNFIKEKSEVYEIGYHDLNMLCDALEGEDLNYGECKCPMIPDVLPKMSPGKMRLIPLYAHDNHTWEGKYRLKKYAGQLVPGVPQTDIDYRYCGAYLGLAFRYLSMEQHRRIADWYKVSFTVKKDGKPVNCDFFKNLYRTLY